MLSVRRRATEAHPPVVFSNRPASSRVPLAGLLAVGAACGVLVALSVPPFGFWPLGWIGFGGAAFFLPGSSVGRRVVLGLGLGLGQYVIGLAWVSEFSIPGCIALMAMGGLFAAAALAVVPCSRASAVAAGFPASFVIADWVRARFPLGGLPLGGASLGQAVSPLVPTARLGGSLLLTGETVLAGVVLAQLALSALFMRSPGDGGSQGGRHSGVAGHAVTIACSAVAAIAFPLAGWLSPNGQGVRHAPLRVALVQGGGERGTRAIHTDPAIVFERHFMAAESVRPPVDLVVMPEGILQVDRAFAESTEAAQLAGLAQSLHATVVAGVEQDVGATRYLNEVAAWSPAGSVVGEYVKNHLVPFGEYVPWRSFISHYFNISDVPLDAIPGHSAGFMRTPAGPVGVMISYEVFFDERARSGVRSGGQVLLVPTNTASYRSSQVPAQELAAARLRAWETGRWLLQVTPTGYTAAVTSDGRVVSRSRLGAQQVIEATVPRFSGRTVYVATGDTPWVLAAGFLLIWMALMPRVVGAAPRRRTRSRIITEPRSDQDRPVRDGPVVLLVCTGNQCRSPMASAILADLLDERESDLKVESAGLVSEGAPCPEEVLAVMAPAGYDLSAHRSRPIRRGELEAADLIVGMTRQHSIDLSLMAPSARTRTFTLWELVRLGEMFGPRMSGESLQQWVSRVGSDRPRSSSLNLPLAEDIPDPIGRPLRAYTETRESLLKLAKRLADLLEPV